jgi:hypothetical protein
MVTIRSRVEQIAEKIGAESFRDPVYRAIYNALIAAEPDATVGELSTGLDEEAIGALEDILAEGAFQMDPERTISDSLETLRARDLAQRAEELDRVIPLVDGAQKDKLIAEKVAIRDELKGAKVAGNFKMFRQTGAR